jgi:arginine/ornithine transport system substrate-binding protein
VLRASTHDRFATEVLAPAGIILVRYGSQQEANLDMVSGRVDALLADSVNLDDGFLKTDAGKGFTFVGPEYNDPKYFGGGAGIAVRKGDTALAEQFNTAINEIRANGKYKQVQDKYFKFDVYGE